MFVKELGEFGLIEKLRKLVGTSPRSLVKGIGDDCAVLELNLKEYLLFTTDALVQGIHFDLRYFPFYFVGWKGMVANISDIAAMGGTPWGAIITLGLPSSSKVEEVDEIYRGAKAASKSYNVPVIGGDIVKSPNRFFLSLALVGKVKKRDLKLRSGAKPGDILAVTGSLGASEAGMRLLKRRKKTGLKELNTLSRKAPYGSHLGPKARLKEAETLVSNFSISSMIDLSDGLASDIHRLREESRVGAEIFEASLPIAASTRKAAKRLGLSPLKLALFGGEDYELLFTIPQRELKKIQNKRLDFPVSIIGRILPERMGISLVDTSYRRNRLAPEGYAHF
jgi:thiamine-monophosphate kinase